eukprot:GHVL01033014.1.p1 GENE.GHVL01033014.1~~GHVL01033014.1.p1  ORF type:complete len:185 (-),score=25.73 GHVL01033014.1:874-1428(-)
MFGGTSSGGFGAGTSTFGGGFGGGIFGGNTTAALPVNTNNDIELQGPPSDAASSLSWAKLGLNQLILACSSWDKSVRIWSVTTSGTSVQANPACNLQHDEPLLHSCFNTAGSSLFSCGCDNKAWMWNLQTQQKQQVAQHDAPIKRCIFLDDLNLLITGSWDKTIKFWDLRQPVAVGTLPLPDKV